MTGRVNYLFINFVENNWLVFNDNEDSSSVKPKSRGKKSISKFMVFN